MDINQAKTAVMKRAASDSEFRAMALQNGAGAIEAVGGTLAAGESVSFSEADLPTGSAGGELSDDALDQASGGGPSDSTYYCGQGATSHVSRC